jgi:hypothetical protein
MRVLRDLFLSRMALTKFDKIDKNTNKLFTPNYA